MLAEIRHQRDVVDDGAAQGGEASALDQSRAAHQHELSAGDRGAAAVGGGVPVAEHEVEQTEDGGDEKGLADAVCLLRTGDRNGIELPARCSGVRAAEQVGRQTSVGIDEQDPGLGEVGELRRARSACPAGRAPSVQAVSARRRG